MKTEDLSKTFVSIPLKGDDDDSILKNYQAVEPDLQKINGGNIQLAGLQCRWPASLPAPSARTRSAPRWPPSRWCASCCSSSSAV